MDTTESKNNEVEIKKTVPQDSTTSLEVTKEEKVNAETNEAVAEDQNDSTEQSDTKTIETEEKPVEVETEKTETTIEEKEVVAEEKTETTIEEKEVVEGKVEATIDEKEVIAEEKTEAVIEEKEVGEENAEVTIDEKEVVEEKTEVVIEDTESTKETPKGDDAKKEDISMEVDYDNQSLEELASSLNELVSTDNIESIKKAVGNIKSNYIKKIKQIKQDHYDKHISGGGTEDDYKTLNFEFEDVYRSAFNIYKEKRREYVAQMETMKVDNLKKKNDLLENLRSMINSEENLNTVYKAFQKLQEDWRDIGLVPQGEVKNLWENYHFLVEKFFDKVKLNRELMMIGLNKNLEQKIQLCEKTEELLLEKSINKSFLTLQDYHTKWKEVGPVPNEKNDEIWERFKNASDKINERRQFHYEEMHKEQLQNLHLKTALCEKIESMMENLPDDIKDWNNKTDDINSVFAEWKTLGPTPKKHNDDIWMRFKTSMNNFFNEKKNYFGKIKDEQMNNYQLKRNLVEQANAIKDSQEWKDTTHSLIELQKKWKTIGTVPRKYSNTIWKEFRSSCDHFFNAKDEFFKGMKSNEKENKAKKLELIEKFEQQAFTDDNKASLEIIKTYQRDWIKIGRVPIKDKNSLQTSFQKAVDKHLTELNIDQFEFQNATFKTKLDGAENTQDAERMIQKEITFIKGKVESIVKDVTLWENNMSFFSSSKNADLLKADFEKKIDKAKKDLAAFKSKLRNFDKMRRDL